MTAGLKYLSVCSGIEAATQAWHPLGMRPIAFSEIDPFPAAVLSHHYPHVQNWGDMTKFQGWPDADVDILVGGTPCQSFSVAGLRKGLADPRGNLMLTYLAIAARYKPRWLAWENVPGVLSSGGGRDFGAFLGALGELGYGFGYRVLDAQHIRTRRFGRAVPQRRRRVFVVGYFGDWRRAAAVLFDRESLSGHPAPRREAGQGFTHDVAPSLVSGGRGVARAGDPQGQDHVVGIARDQPITTQGRIICFDSKGTEVQHNNDFAPTLRSIGQLAVAFDLNQITSPTNRSRPDPSVCHTLPASPVAPHLAMPSAVRRLTPRECERLQGFPDDFTAIPWRGEPADKCPDGPRYKALGNSMAVNCMEWIGERILEVTQW